jgi:hypothetical protein
MRLGPSSSAKRRWMKSLTFVPILAVLALAAWAFSSPVGSSPDDDFHLPSIWCAAGQKADACADTADSSKRVVPQDLVVKSVCYAYKANKSADCQGKDFGTHPKTVTTVTRGNFSQALYPPVFYLAMSVFVGPNIDVSVLMMRLANSLLFVLLGTALFLLLPRRLRPTYLWSVAVTLVPLGMFFIPSTNPSSWAIISAGVLFLALLGFFETRGRQRIGLAVIAVLATVMAAGARADAAVFSGVAVVAAMIITARRTRQYLIAAILPVVLVLTALAFWVTSGQSEAATTGLAPHGGGSVSILDLTVTDLLDVPDLWVGAFGHWGLGWLDTALPAVVWAVGFGIFCAALFIGFRTRHRRKGIAAALVFAVLWIFPTALLVQTRALVGSYVQPRYIYPLIILLASVVLVQRIRGQVSFSRLQLWIGVSAVSVANAVALHTNIRRYVTGADVGGLNLDSHVEWWWNIGIPPMGVWAIGSAAFAAALLLAARGLWRGTDADDPSPVEPAGIDGPDRVSSVGDLSSVDNRSADQKVTVE